MQVSALEGAAEDVVKIVVVGATVDEGTSVGLAELEDDFGADEEEAGIDEYTEDDE